MSERPAAILCIDDEEPSLTLRRIVLERAGYLVFTALTGKQGIDIFRSQPVDLVILDYWMADMDGLDVAAELKSIRAKTPIIMLSGYVPYSTRHWVRLTCGCAKVKAIPSTC